MVEQVVEEDLVGHRLPAPWRSQETAVTSPVVSQPILVMNPV